MMISTRGRYALRVMVDLAENGGGRTAVPLSEVSRRLNISRKYLESIMTTLVKAELVASLPGKAGGYHLARDSADYTVLEILSLAEGSLSPVSCAGENCRDDCPDRAFCPIAPLWEGLDRTIRDYLASVRLSDLVRQNA